MNTQTPLTRRNFLKTTVAGTAAAAAFPTIVPSSVFGQDAPSKLIQVGQIGCGRIARDMDLRGLLGQPGLARVVAVCDLDSKRVADGKKLVEASYSKSGKPAGEVKTYENYQEMLQRTDIDAISISTPDHWHAQPIIEAALAGKDIWVQKPFSLTIAEGRLVSDVVRTTKRVFQIGSQQRSSQQFYRACQLVRNGAIGKIKTIQVGLPIDPAGGKKDEMPVPPTFNYKMWLGCTPDVYYTEDRVHPQKDYGRPGWLRCEQFGAGMITGWGSHHLDIAHWAMGVETSGPISVDAKATFPGPDSFWNVHGKYSIKLTYANGAVMTINDELPNGLRFEGETGWIWVSRGDAAVTSSDPTAGQKANKAFNASDPKLLTADLSGDKIQLHRSPKWNHHLDWLEAVRNRTQPVTSPEAAHRSCSACLISWIGMKLGRPLKWNPETERFNDDEANAMLTRVEREPYGAFRAAKKANFKKNI